MSLDHGRNLVHPQKTNGATELGLGKGISFVILPLNVTVQVFVLLIAWLTS